MDYDHNPFPEPDADRFRLWEMLVRRDIDAFISQDWSRVSDDFTEENFTGISGNKSADPDKWTPTYHDLDAYKRDWLKQAKEFFSFRYRDDVREALFRATKLRDITITGQTAMLHKKFDGHITREDGGVERINWQTLYICKKKSGVWKIAGFVGYLPNPMG